ncbi:VOC family protein [Streptosporangiaceae bacterium NEAU-GS5]|nr:VOC family protein [Streptosporangiaceae bacterium NEAU-GS5]
MLRGMSTVRYQAADFEAAKKWYVEVLGVEPYFERPGYAEFRIGDHQHELGLLDAAYATMLRAPANPPTGSTAPQPSTGVAADGRGGDSGVGSGAVIYWHVDDVTAAYDRLLTLGATPHEPPRQFGEGFIGAAVVDPFGNVLGVMYNQHYLDMLPAAGAE